MPSVLSSLAGGGADWSAAAAAAAAAAVGLGLGAPSSSAAAAAAAAVSPWSHLHAPLSRSSRAHAVQQLAARMVAGLGSLSLASEPAAVAAVSIPAMASAAASRMVDASTATSATLLAAAPALDAAAAAAAASAVPPSLFARLRDLSVDGWSVQFARDLLRSLLRFLYARLKHSSWFLSLVTQLQQWWTFVRSRPSALAAQGPTGKASVDLSIAAARLLHRLLWTAGGFLVWVFHPLLFIRRLYRLCVGLLVLYVLHFLLGYLGAKVAAAREWWRVERGLWRGEEQWVRKRELTLAMASAPDYTTWRAAASQLDLLESERMAWKAYRPSTEYHWKRIARNVESIRKLIAAHQAQQEKTRQMLSGEHTAQQQLQQQLSSSAPLSSSAATSAAAAHAAATSTAAIPAPSSSSSAEPAQSAPAPSSSGSSTAASSPSVRLGVPPSAPGSGSGSTAALASTLHAASASSSSAPPPSAGCAPFGGAVAPAPSSSAPLTPESLGVFPTCSSNDPHALMRYLRSRLMRNIGNSTNTSLYFDAEKDSSFSSTFPSVKDATANFNPSVPLSLRVGTKALIEEYHAEVIRGLETILADPSIASQTKLAFFRETRHAFGRSALLLNGGANLGMLHLGVVKALLEIDSLPQIISGSSVGAIFAALICSRTDDELHKIGSPDFLQLSFPSVRGSLRRKLKRFLSEGILMDISSLIHCVRSHIGDITFEQAYQRYGRICNVIVTPIHMGRKKRSRGERAGPGPLAQDDSNMAFEESESEQQHSSEPILLNYLTAPTVLIWSAACASCAVPHLYRPVELLAKNPAGEVVPYFTSGGGEHEEHVLFGAGCADGSVVKMDVAMDRLRTLFNCNNFIVSQLNLSLLPFIFGGTSFREASPLQKLLRYLAREIYQRVGNLCSLLGFDSSNVESKHSLVRAALFIHSLTSQAINGNITLVPPVSWRDYSQLLENPTTQRLLDCVDVARRYVWTKASLIKAHCVVEFALDRCVRRVRGEVGPGGTSLTASSAAFAHPSRFVPNLTASPFAQSPALGPLSAAMAGASSASGANFWSRKLNARALLPSRKTSWSGEQPQQHQQSQHPIHGLSQHPPLLDLADVARTSPSGLQRSGAATAANLSTAGSNFSTTLFSPSQAGSAAASGAPLHTSYQSPSHASRHQRRESPLVGGSPLANLIPLSPANMPPTVRTTSLRGNGNGTGNGGGAMLVGQGELVHLQPLLQMQQPSAVPSAGGAGAVPASSSGSSNSNSVARSPSPGLDGASQSGSNASTAPSSPRGADALDGAHSASRDSLAPSSTGAPSSTASSKVGSTAQLPASGATSHSNSRAGRGARGGGGSSGGGGGVLSPKPTSPEPVGSNGRNSASSLLRSVPSLPGSSSQSGGGGGSGGGSLLRSVPSLPGSSPTAGSGSRVASFHNSSSSAGVGSSVLIPSSLSGSKLDDAFNSGVMAQLSTQFVFTMPPSAKRANSRRHPKRGGGAAGGGAMHSPATEAAAALSTASGGSDSDQKDAAPVSASGAIPAAATAATAGAAILSLSHPAAAASSGSAGDSGSEQEAEGKRKAESPDQPASAAAAAVTAVAAASAEPSQPERKQQPSTIQAC